MTRRSKRRKKQMQSGNRINASSTSSPASWFVDWMHQRDSDSGVDVNGTTIMQFAPFWYAVNKIASRVGQLPLLLYRIRGKKRTERDEATDHPAYRLMRDWPNEMMTPGVFKETLMHHILLWGNGRAAIVRDGKRAPVELWPMLPDRTTTVLLAGPDEQQARSAAQIVTQSSSPWQKWHRVSFEGQATFLHDDDVLHIPGLGYDGIVGYSLIDFARNSAGLGLASERQSNRHYKHGAQPGLILKAPPGVFRKPEDATEFLRQFREYHEGSDNVGKTALLREGIEAVPLTMSAKDSETTAMRLTQREEAALWFLLESIIGEKSSQSYNSLEQRNRAELINTLGRWLRRWVEECNRKLLTWKQQIDMSHEFQWDTQELLTSTLSETMTFLGQAIEKRILSPNEARDWLGYPPYEGGDKYENPNTSSPNKATEDDAPDDAMETPDEDMPEEDMPEEPMESAGSTAIARRLLSNCLQQLLRVEAHRAEQAAAKPDKFLSWLTEFYSAEEFGGVIRSTYTLAGDSGKWATYHIDASQQSLLSVSGHATSSTLSRDVARELADWPIRAEQYAEMVITGQLNATQ